MGLINKMKLITKLIPANIRIKSLYWVKKEKEIDSDLLLLFSLIDNDKYLEAEETLNDLKNKWVEQFHHAPEWFIFEYKPQFVRAEAMISFLKA